MPGGDPNRSAISPIASRQRKTGRDSGAGTHLAVTAPDGNLQMFSRTPFISRRVGCFTATLGQDLTVWTILQACLSLAGETAGGEQEYDQK